MYQSNRENLKFNQGNLTIELDCRGQDQYTKVSYPVKYGRFFRLETDAHILEFNLNHEIRHARSKTREWLHPSEWLKRTNGNDWVYYSSGGYAGVFEALGEFYLPNLTYPTNSLLGGKPFREKPIETIVNSWHDILAQSLETDLPEPFLNFKTKALENTPSKLALRSEQLFEIIGSRVSVMPPDARHVDYNIIPLNISDGCLYKCRFCKVKNKHRFQTRSASGIADQMQKLKKWFGKDLKNYNAVYLGEHDALNSDDDTIIDTITQACQAFEFSESCLKDEYIFMFGSVGSFAKKSDAFFQTLNKSGKKIFINVGLESNDDKTLKKIGKPITSRDVTQAFERIQQINQTLDAIEITGNFIMDEDLPDSHYNSVMDLIRNRMNHIYPKGSIYFSPLQFAKPSRAVLYDFYRLKTQSRLPTFLYLIQRL